MGVSNPSEVDEVHLTFSFPEMHAFKNSGAKGPSFVEFQMFFEFTQDGSNFISALAFGPSNAAILSRGSTAPWGNAVTYGVRSRALYRICKTKRRTILRIYRRVCYEC